MSFREITMQDVSEVLRRSQAGQSARQIARETGLDRKTVEGSILRELNAKQEDLTRTMKALVDFSTCNLAELNLADLERLGAHAKNVATLVALVAADLNRARDVLQEEICKFNDLLRQWDEAPLSGESNIGANTSLRGLEERLSVFERERSEKQGELNMREANLRNCIARLRERLRNIEGLAALAYDLFDCLLRSRSLDSGSISLRYMNEHRDELEQTGLTFTKKEAEEMSAVSELRHAYGHWNNAAEKRRRACLKLGRKSPEDATREALTRVGDWLFKGHPRRQDYLLRVVDHLMRA
jgi:hypothetical protein